MPIIYLSPSSQEFNPYVTTGNEEYWMNIIADEMVPWLRSCGIQYTRNTKEMTAYESILASNRGNYALHLALHSNASADGSVRGCVVFYYPGSVQGKAAADIFVANLRKIYPLPDKVNAVPTTTIGEVAKVRAPGILIEFAFHDNVEDANWITGNTEAIAQNVVLSLTEYFGIPFLYPMPERQGVVDVSWGALNIRARPSTQAPIIAKVYDGKRLTVINRWEDWYLVEVDGIIGYAAQAYITLLNS